MAQAQDKTGDDVVTQAIQAMQAQQQPAAVAPVAATPPDAAAPTTNPADPADPNAPVTPTYEQQKFAVLQTLDKVTARTATVTVPVGKAAAVGPLFLDVKTCQKTPPTEQPEAAAFLQIWEAAPKEKLADKQSAQWVFSGWMYASSPALSAIDHPIYDVWLKDCANAMPKGNVK